MNEEDVIKLIDEKLSALNKKEEQTVDQIVEEEKRKNEEKAKADAILKEEARRVAFLDSVKLDEIEDEVAKNTVATILSSSMDSSEKVKTVSALITSSKVKSILAKVESLPGEDMVELSKYSLDNLKSVQAKGHNLSKYDVEKANDAISVISESLKKIADKKISSAVNGLVDYDKMPAEKKLAFKSSIMALDVQKMRNERLVMMKEKLGVL